MKQFADITANIAIEVGDSVYIAALDNGGLAIGEPRDEGKADKVTNILFLFPFFLSGNLEIAAVYDLALFENFNYA